jgi:hypothetical protein
MEHCHAHHAASKQACERESDNNKDHQRHDCHHQYPQLAALLPSGFHIASNTSVPNPPAGCLALVASAWSGNEADAARAGLPLRSPPSLAIITRLRI